MFIGLAWSAELKQTNKKRGRREREPFFYEKSKIEEGKRNI